MSASTDQVAKLCRALLDPASESPRKTLQEYLCAIPRLDALADVTRGTAVLVRGDVDAKPGAQLGEGDIRLRSMVETLEFGRQRGWIQVVFGHIGRKPEGSLKAVAKRLGELLKIEVPLVTDWLDEGSLAVSAQAAKAVAD